MEDTSTIVKTSASPAPLACDPQQCVYLAETLISVGKQHKSASNRGGGYKLTILGVEWSYDNYFGWGESNGFTCKAGLTQTTSAALEKIAGRKCGVSISY